MAKGVFWVRLRRRDGEKGKSVPSTHPAARAQKFASELKYGVNSYTDKKLTKNEKAWRAGYMTARQDAAKQHNAQADVNYRKQRQSMYNSLFGNKR